jgi:hypothetical protein
LLAGAIVFGWEIKRISHRLAQMRHVPDQPSSVRHSSSGLRPVNAVTADPRVTEVMTRYHLGRKTGNYIAQAKMQIVD